MPPRWRAPTRASRGTCPKPGWSVWSRSSSSIAARGVSEYREISIDGSTQTRDEMVALTGRRTVPQIYINRQHVGGFEDLATLDRRGGLLPLMEQAP